MLIRYLYLVILHWHLRTQKCKRHKEIINLQNQLQTLIHHHKRISKGSKPNPSTQTDIHDSTQFISYLLNYSNPITQYLKLKSLSPALPEYSNFIIRVYACLSSHIHPPQRISILRPLFQIYILVMVPNWRLLITDIPYHSIKLVARQHVIAHLQGPVSENILKHLMVR